MGIKFARPVHPGEFLREEYLRPLDLSAGALSRHIGVPRTRIERLTKEEVALTSDTALRLARYFDTTPEFWMNFQTAFDLASTERELATELDTIVARSRAE